jgi:uncharacterized protein
MDSNGYSGLVQIEQRVDVEIPPAEQALKTGRHWTGGTLRASSYIIYVDLPGNSEEMLLVHGYSGAYDKVSRSVASYLRSLEVRRPPKPLYGTWSAEPSTEGETTPPSDETIRLLRKRGYLTTLAIEQEEELLYKMATKVHEKHSRQNPSYILMPTYNCNLRCSYCFQDHMRTDPSLRHLLKRMSIETVDRIFSAMPRIEAMHGCSADGPQRRNVGLFGGEPLLSENRPVIEHVLDKAFSMGGATIWAVSNATELDAYRDLLYPDKIASVQVTLDGPPREHDQRRIYADGSGSFAKIAPNITMALDQGVFISIRMNVDRNNLAQLPELAEVIHAHGWDHYTNFSAYTAPIRAMNGNVHRSTTLDISQLSKAQADLTREHPLLGFMERPDMAIKQNARYIFHNGEACSPIMRESYCSAHTGMYIFDTFGDIYVCWEKTGDPSTRIGHIKDDGSLELNDSQVQLWHTRTVASNPVCRKCRYALHCGGGCAVLALRQSGEYHSNYCDGFANSFRSSVAEAYLEHVSGAPLAAKAARVCDQ